MDKDIAHKNKLLSQLERRLRHLEIRKATYGIDIPSQVIIEIEDINKQIEDIKKDILIDNYNDKNSNISNVSKISVRISIFLVLIICFAIIYPSFVIIDRFIRIDEILNDNLSIILLKILLSIFVIFSVLSRSNFIDLYVYKFVEYVKSFRYDADDKFRRLKRQRFAQYIEAEIRGLNVSDSWNDNKFTELDVEVEIEFQKLWFRRYKIPFISNTSIKRTNSLSKALNINNERLVLLEGEPGSGKSVALRHIVLTMAGKASKSNSIHSVIPIYINLKHLKRKDGQLVNRNFIEDFVLETLRRANDRDVEEFLDEEFNRGLKDGGWFFFFDSFDEIPEVLSSTDSDENIRLYADAIRDFLYGLNICRGIVASREYRGPRLLGWPRLRILQLTSSKKEELIKKVGLHKEVQSAIITGISLSKPEFRSVTSNPMFLSLLCDYMRDRNEIAFPEHTYSVFENYIQKRLFRDKDRIEKRFSKTIQDIRMAAEIFAFCMTNDPDIGLSPSRKRLLRAIERNNFNIGQDFDIFADALEFLKLAHSESTLLDKEDKPFTFAHRRFQEYFATSVVLQESDRVSDLDLLTNLQWRETAVVILQTQKPESTKSLLNSCYDYILFITKDFDLDLINLKEKDKANSENIPRINRSRLSYSNFKDNWNKMIAEAKESRREFRESAERLKENYFDKEFLYSNLYQKMRFIAWPASLYHILGILQDGFSGRQQILPAKLRTLVSKILYYIFFSGTIIDKKWSLEVAGCTDENTLSELVYRGFMNSSRLLNDIAYKQISKLGMITPEISNRIHSEITIMMINGSLWQKRKDVNIHLSRIEESDKYLNVLRLMTSIPFIDIILIILSFLLFLYFIPYDIIGIFVFVLMIFLSIIRWRSDVVNKAILFFNPDSIFIFLSLFAVSLAMILIFKYYSHVLFLPIFVYYVLWFPSALSLSQSKKMNKVIYWPFYSIISLIYVIRFIISLFVYTLIFLVRFPLLFVFSTLSLFIYMLIYSYELVALIYRERRFIVNYIGNIFLNVISYITYISFGKKFLILFIFFCIIYCI